jgi:hypothetical protein
MPYTARGRLADTIKGDIRSEIAEDFSRVYKQGIARLEEVTSREGAYTGKCPNCRRDVRVDNVPPIRDIVLALQFLADQGIGKPQAAKVEPPKAGLITASITEASDEELAKLLEETEKSAP